MAGVFTLGFCLLALLVLTTRRRPGLKFPEGYKAQRARWRKFARRHQVPGAEKGFVFLGVATVKFDNTLSRILSYSSLRVIRPRRWYKKGAGFLVEHVQRNGFEARTEALAELINIYSKPSDVFAKF